MSDLYDDDGFPITDAAPASGQIIFRFSNEAGARPAVSSIEEGELFINLADRAIVTKRGGSIITLGGGSVQIDVVPSLPPAGDREGELVEFNNSLWYSTGIAWVDLGATGGGVSDGNKGDITVAGSSWTINAGAVSTNELGGDITPAGKALLDDASPAAQRTTLGLGSAATQPSTAFALASHLHGIPDVGGLQAALDAKAALTHTHAIGDVSGLQGALDAKANASHTHTASQISDSTAAGRALLTAADAAAQRTALGLGTAATHNEGSGNGLDADLLDGVEGANYLASRGAVADTALDSATLNGFYTVNYTGHSRSLLTWNAGGSSGPVQIEHYWTGQLRFRNRTDNTTWTAWRNLWHDGNLLNIGTTATSARTALGLGTAATSALSTTNAAALGTAAPGSGTTVARADHVHPMPTAAQVGAAPTSHTHTATQISDSTVAGRALLTATDVAAQRASLGLGTASLSATADFAPAAHVGSGGTAHATATTAVAGFMSAADKTKLDGVAAGATANATDAQLRDRSTHTGTQGIGTITMNTARLLGRTTAGVGAVEEVSVGAGLSLASGILSATGGGVTSVAAAGSTGLTVGGSPITSSGTLSFTLSANLQSWSAVSPSSYGTLSGANVWGASQTFNGIVAIRQGTASTQSVLQSMGWSTGNIRWNSIIEADADLAFYCYDVNGTNAFARLTLDNAVGGSALVIGASTMTYGGSTVWHAGNLLNIGTTAASARTALGLGSAATSATTDFAAATHTHAASAITSGTLDIARLPVATSGTSNTTQVVRADDARLSDARTPTAHTHDASAIISGVLGTARLGTGTANSTVFLRGDGTWATVTASVSWGGIGGTLSNQTDLQNALNSKANISNPAFAGTVSLSDISGSGSCSFVGTYTSSGSGSAFVVWDRTGGFAQAWVWYATGNVMRFFHNSAGDRMTLTQAGNLTIWGTLAQNASDARLKTGLTPITHATAKLGAIGGYLGYWDIEKCNSVGFFPDDKQQHFLVAQEVKEVVPDAVLPAGCGDGKYMTVAYDKLVPLMIEAIKELDSRVKALESQLENT